MFNKAKSAAAAAKQAVTGDYSEALKLIAAQISDPAKLQDSEAFYKMLKSIPQSVRAGFDGALPLHRAAAAGNIAAVTQLARYYFDERMKPSLLASSAVKPDPVYMQAKFAMELATDQGKKTFGELIINMYYELIQKETKSDEEKAFFENEYTKRLMKEYGSWMDKRVNTRTTDDGAVAEVERLAKFFPAYNNNENMQTYLKNLGDIFHSVFPLDTRVYALTILECCVKLIDSATLAEKSLADIQKLTRSLFEAWHYQIRNVTKPTDLAHIKAKKLAKTIMEINFVQKFSEEPSEENLGNCAAIINFMQEIELGEALLYKDGNMEGEAFIEKRNYALISYKHAESNDTFWPYIFQPQTDSDTRAAFIKMAADFFETKYRQELFLSKWKPYSRYVAKFYKNPDLGIKLSKEIALTVLRDEAAGSEFVAAIKRGEVITFFNFYNDTQYQNYMEKVFPREHGLTGLTESFWDLLSCLHANVEGVPSKLKAELAVAYVQLRNKKIDIYKNFERRFYRREERDDADKAKCLKDVDIFDIFANIDFDFETLFRIFNTHDGAAHSNTMRSKMKAAMMHSDSSDEKIVALGLLYQGGNSSSFDFFADIDFDFETLIRIFQGNENAAKSNTMRSKMKTAMIQSNESEKRVAAFKLLREGFEDSTAFDSFLSADDSGFELTPAEAQSLNAEHYTSRHISIALGVLNYQQSATNDPYALNLESLCKAYGTDGTLVPLAVIRSMLRSAKIDANLFYPFVVKNAAMHSGFAIASLLQALQGINITDNTSLTACVDDKCALHYAARSNNIEIYKIVLGRYLEQTHNATLMQILFQEFSAKDSAVKKNVFDMTKDNRMFLYTTLKMLDERGLVDERLTTEATEKGIFLDPVAILRASNSLSATEQKFFMQQALAMGDEKTQELREFILENYNAGDSQCEISAELKVFGVQHADALNIVKDPTKLMALAKAHFGQENGLRNERIKQFVIERDQTDMDNTMLHKAASPNARDYEFILWATHETDVLQRIYEHNKGENAAFSSPEDLLNQVTTANGEGAVHSDHAAALTMLSPPDAGTKKVFTGEGAGSSSAAGCTTNGSGSGAPSAPTKEVADAAAAESCAQADCSPDVENEETDATAAASCTTNGSASGEPSVDEEAPPPYTPPPPTAPDAEDEAQSTDADDDIMPSVKTVFLPAFASSASSARNDEARLAEMLAQQKAEIAAMLARHEAQIRSFVEQNIPDQNRKNSL